MFNFVIATGSARAAKLMPVRAARVRTARAEAARGRAGASAVRLRHLCVIRSGRGILNLY